MSGHIIDMVNRIRQNKIPKRRKFKGDNRETIYSNGTSENTEYDFPTASEVEIFQMKLRLEQNAKMNLRKSLFSLVICIALAALLIWSLIRYVL